MRGWRQGSCPHRVCHTETTPVPKMGHNLEGFGDCLTCHGPGKLAALPTSHLNRSVSTCTVCHTETSPPTKVPHSLASNEACASCHNGLVIKALPASHGGRAATTCAICHSETIQPPTGSSGVGFAIARGEE